MTSLGLAMLIGGAGMTAAAPALANPEFKLRGRMHLDAALWDEDDVPLNDSTNFRRTRLGVTGKIDDVWSGIIEYDFAENGTSANDVMINRKLGDGTLKIGQFKVPMGLNELTSSNSITVHRARHAPATWWWTPAVSASAMTGSQGDIGFQVHGASAAAIGSKCQNGDDPLGLGAPLRVRAQAQRHQPVPLRRRRRPMKIVRDDNVPAVSRPSRSSRPGGGVRLIDTGNIADVDTTMKYGHRAGLPVGSAVSVETEYLQCGRQPRRRRRAELRRLLRADQLRADRREPRLSQRRVPRRHPGPGKDRGAWELAARLQLRGPGRLGLLQGGEQENFTHRRELLLQRQRPLHAQLHHRSTSTDSAASANWRHVVGDDEPERAGRPRAVPLLGRRRSVTPRDEAAMVMDHGRFTSGQRASASGALRVL
jgi:phosphate-selective porin OprO and OprP